MKQITFINDDKVSYDIIVSEDVCTLYDIEDREFITLFNKDEAIGAAKMALMLMENIYYACVVKTTWKYDSTGTLTVSNIELIWEANSTEYENDISEDDDKLS